MRSIETSIFFQKSLEQHSHEDPLPRPVGVRDSVSADRWLYRLGEGASVAAREVTYVFWITNSKAGYYAHRAFPRRSSIRTLPYTARLDIAFVSRTLASMYVQ